MLQSLLPATSCSRRTKYLKSKAALTICLYVLTFSFVNYGLGFKQFATKKDVFIQGSELHVDLVKKIAFNKNFMIFFIFHKKKLHLDYLYYKIILKSKYLYCKYIKSLVKLLKITILKI